VHVKPWRRSRIQIDQSMAEGEPRRVIIMGEPTAVQLGEAMVRAVMENGPAGMNQVQASHMFGAAPSAIPGQDPTNPYVSHSRHAHTTDAQPTHARTPCLMTCGPVGRLHLMVP
jgi:hypothetical protein